MSGSVVTPCFVFERDVVRARLARLRALPTRLLYAMKANPHPEVLRLLLGQVEGVDVASESELESVLSVGWSGASASLTGPAKTDAFLARGVEVGAVVNVESWRELERLEPLARARSTKARVRLRINPRKTFKAFRLHMTGAPSPFGIDEEELEVVLPRVSDAVKAGWLALEGVHLHPGSQGTSVAGVIHVVAEGLTLLERVRRQTGVEISSVNFGGGFGVIGPDELDVEALAPRVAEVLELFTRRAGFTPEPWFEPGRWLVGPAGQYLTRVVSTKVSRGVRFTVLDGGVHQLMARAEWLLPPKAARAPVHNLTRPDAPRVLTTLVGALCTPLDTFGPFELPEPREGDVLSFSEAGAYGLTFSPHSFLGHQRPAEVFR